MSYIFLVRHGETQWNKEKRYQGTSDIPLSLAGIKKVNTLARASRYLKAEVVYSSVLQRAQQTASIMTRQMKVKPQLDARLNEMNFGCWEGKTAEELLKAHDASYERFLNGEWMRPFGGESMQEVQLRIRKFWWECLKRHHGQNVMIVSHAGPIKMIVLEALGLSRKHLFQMHLDTSSLTVLERYDSFFQLIKFNYVYDL